MKKRSSMKGILTRNMNIMDELTKDVRNLQVKEKLNAFPENIKRFENAHAELLSLPLDEEQYKKEEEYKVAVLTHAMELQEGIYNWLGQYEDDDEAEEDPEESDDAGSLHISKEDSLREENKRLEEELQELTKKTLQRQLELRNVMLKRERQKLIEEEKLQDELHSETVEHLLDTEGSHYTLH